MNRSRQLFGLVPFSAISPALQRGSLSCVPLVRALYHKLRQFSSSHTTSWTMIDTDPRLAALRALYPQHNINAYIVPSEDAHQVSCRLRRKPNRCGLGLVRVPCRV